MRPPTADTLPLRPPPSRQPIVNNQERVIVAGVLLLTCMLVGIDLFNDTGEGVALWHIVAEAATGLSALVALFYLLRGALVLRRQLRQEVESSSALREQAERWRAESRRHVDGLAKAIDLQLSQWQLTSAEKEVAFLLLKGFGFKEIARARDTSEKTARAQSAAIYAKAGLSGRSELAAFFLEDLLVPREPRHG